MCVLGSTSNCDRFDHAFSSSQIRILKMQSKDTLYSVATAIAIALTMHTNTAYINTVYKSDIVIDRLLVNMDDKLNETPPPKKQQKLSSYATFPQTKSSTSTPKTNKDVELFV